MVATYTYKVAGAEKINGLVTALRRESFKIHYGLQIQKMLKDKFHQLATERGMFIELRGYSS